MAGGEKGSEEKKSWVNEMEAGWWCGWAILYKMLREDF